MTAAHETVLFDCHDFKVYAMLTDSSAASPTYGPAVDVPGINQVSLDPNVVSAVLKGDGRTVARRGRTDSFKLAAQNAKLALDAVAVMYGGAVVDVSGNEAAWSLAGPAPLPYFKSEFKIDDVDLGLATVHFILFKSQLSGGKLAGQQSDQFGQPTMDIEGIQPDFATTPMVKIRLLTVATPLDA